MSENRTRYGDEPLTPQRRADISQAIQTAIHRLQATKNSIEEPRPIMFRDCDELLTHLEDASHAIATAQELLT